MTKHDYTSYYVIGLVGFGVFLILCGMVIEALKFLALVKWVFG